MPYDADAGACTVDCDCGVVHYDSVRCSIVICEPYLKGQLRYWLDIWVVEPSVEVVVGSCDASIL